MATLPLSIAVHSREYRRIVDAKENYIATVRVEDSEVVLNTLREKYELTCPKCGGEATEAYHSGNASVPECHYKLCSDCGHQWGHE